MRKFLPLVVLLLACMVNSGAGADPKQEWQLRTMKVKGKAYALVEGTPVTLVFLEAGKIAGKASVNSYFGTMKEEGGKLSWSPLGSTRMAGPDPLMKQESTFLEALAQTTHREQKGKVLVLTSADQQTELEFVGK